MGQYILIGVATNLEIGRKRRSLGDSDDPLKQKEKVLGQLSKRIDLSLFTVNDSKKAIELAIIPELFAAHIHDFLKEQFSMVYGPGDAQAAKALAAIEGKNYTEMMACASSDSPPYYFQRHHSGGYGSTYLLDDYDLGFEMILFFMEGKAMLECYYKLFPYIGALVRKASCNPLKGAVVVDLG